MSKVLRRTAYSPNIKERADFSCAIFDERGKLLAQAEAIPVHLGSMSFVAKPIIEQFKNWNDGDAIITNSPRKEYGGTHLPDITLLTPVFDKGELIYVVANRAHHADVGGMVPGSLPANSIEIFQEGLIIPPVKLFEQGVENEDIMRFILENVRTPQERAGDLRAQYSSLRLGKQRLEEMLEENPDWTREYHEELLRQSRQGTENRLQKLGTGSATFTDKLDSDGYSDNPVEIQCKVTLGENTIEFDFSGTDDERPGNCNAPLSITTAACSYILRLLTGREVPTNAGCFEPMKIYAPQNTVVNPSPNAATSSANTETSSRIVDVLMGAIAQLTPFPSASQGTMNNVMIGGSHEDGSNWSIYETIGGGTGAGPKQEGTDAIHSHMTNTENTPIEAIELTYPLRVREYSIRRGSGGKGGSEGFNGGDGIIRELELLDTATITLQTERRKFAPWSQGKTAKPGSKGKNILILPEKLDQKNKNKQKILSSRTSKENLPKGTRLRLLTPGGGGFSD